MKKIVVMLMVVVLMLTMVSCNENTKTNVETPKDITEIEIPSEDTYVGEIYIGRTYNYGDYYLFISYSTKSYLLFLDGMAEQIEILDISMSESSGYAERYWVTYKLLNTPQ